ncbi:hypothetical protein LAZ54_26030 [Vibrio alginolyticus]|nr:hypothetical protein [Vibrio alginolyticus]MCA2422868.1 hypothetical protein [Vibrio alginolyticus]MCA2423354.1 hypothetical protein [Vibrio alginolyticus]MCA2447444.1 hypothetical protein [Vibrio alginolyticus]MCA2447496.1 hypothetical protein [Vibrio alginolyticus]
MIKVVCGDIGVALLTP